MSNDFFKFIFHYLPKDEIVSVDFQETGLFAKNEDFLIPVQYFKKLMSSKLTRKTGVQKTTKRVLNDIPQMLKNEGILFYPLTEMSKGLTDYFSRESHLYKISESENQLLRTINQVYNTNILNTDEIYMIGPLIGKSINGINGLKDIIEQYSINLKEKTEISLEDGSTATAYHIHFYPQPFKRPPSNANVEKISSGLQQVGQSRQTFLMRDLPEDTNMNSINVTNSIYYFEIFASQQPLVTKSQLTIHYDGNKKKTIILENFVKEFNKYKEKKNIKFNEKESFKLPQKICKLLGLPDNIIIVNNDDYEALLLELEISVSNRTDLSINFKIIGNVKYKGDNHIVCEILKEGNNSNFTFTNVPVALNNNNRQRQHNVNRRKQGLTKNAVKRNQTFVNQLKSGKLPSPNTLVKDTLIARIPLFIQTLHNTNITNQRFYNLYPYLLQYIKRLQELESNNNNKLGNTYMASIGELQTKFDGKLAKMLQNQQNRRKNQQINQLLKNTKKSFKAANNSNKEKIIKMLLERIKSEENKRTQDKIRSFVGDLMSEMESEKLLREYEAESNLESSSPTFLNELMIQKTKKLNNNDKRKEFLSILVAQRNKLSNNNNNIDRIKLKMNETLIFGINFKVFEEGFVGTWEEKTITVNNINIIINGEEINRKDIKLTDFKKKRKKYSKEQCLTLENSDSKIKLAFETKDERDLFQKIHDLRYQNSSGGKRKPIKKKPTKKKIGVYQTGGGYYYRRFRNGDVKRISKDEYKKRK